MKKLLLLRPEPGLSASADHARSLGLDVVTCPLFAVEPVAWTAPDPAGFDALLLTSANAVRHAGPGFAKVAALPVIAVGEATADAARAAGLNVTMVGVAGAQHLLDDLADKRKLLHLTGVDHGAITDDRVTTLLVYRAGQIDAPNLPVVSNLVIAVHSPRAGARLTQLVGARSGGVVAAISEAAALACGSGWRAIEWAPQPTDSALLALAARLCQSRRP
ncbi:MAG: uroporphyrinogen-III synthase [Sphingomonas bacterium]|nr:uroporphyrinogen-III synthase [Sphingomonas bacterium]